MFYGFCTRYNTRSLGFLFHIIGSVTAAGIGAVLNNKGGKKVER
jgi:hypothetical protein